MHKHPKAKSYIGIFILTSMTIILLYFNAPVPISQKYPALKIKFGDLGHTESCEIIVNGKYYRNLFTFDQFVGTVSISGYSITEQHITLEFTHKTFALISYVEEDISSPTHFGILYCDKYIKNPMILVYDSNVWDCNTGICIAANAVSYDEVVTILYSYIDGTKK